MSIGEYLINSLVGILVVFFALILLMIIIKIITAVTDKAEGKGKAAPEAAAVAPKEEPKVEKVYAPGSAGDLNLYDTDPRDAAMIMAIVADEMKTPLNELRFISIKEIKE